MIIWVIVSVFALITVLLLIGKGGFLIAGYNTASEEEKSRYDPVRLSRVTGACLVPIDSVLILTGVFQQNMPGWLLTVIPLVIFLSVIVMLILGNTCCYRRGVVLSDREKKKNLLVFTGITAVLLVLLAVVMVLVTAGTVDVGFEEEQLTVTAFTRPEEVYDRESIHSVSLEPLPDVGKRKRGIENAKIAAGVFDNDAYGQYTLMVYPDCQTAVVLETDTGIVVINQADQDLTEDCFQQITAWWKA